MRAGPARRDRQTARHERPPRPAAVPAARSCAVADDAASAPWILSASDGPFSAMRPELGAHAPEARRVRAWTVGALVSVSVAAASMAPAWGAVVRADVPSPGEPRRTAAAAQRAAEPPAPRSGQPFIAVQASPSTPLPSLVLPPAASTEPPLFTSLMRMGDSAMVRGEVARARALYERAASVHPASPAAFVAAGKTYDPNTLSLLNMNTAAFADPQKARAWYERARALGDPAAASLLAALR